MTNTNDELEPLLKTNKNYMSNKEITFDVFYNDITNNWNNDNYIIQKITNLNLNECNFSSWQKKLLQGVILQKQKKYKEGLRCFQESNEIEENIYASAKLGYFYHIGIGVKKNINTAISFYKIAVKKGNVMAINNLAVCYQKEESVKDINLAIHFYKLAIEKGNAIAMKNLGICYESGIGVEKHINTAMRLYSMAFEKGNEEAIYYLLNCYQKLTNDEKYKFYKSLPENSNILEKIEEKQIEVELKNIQKKLFF